MDTRTRINQLVVDGRLHEGESQWAEQTIERIGLDTFLWILTMWECYQLQQKVREQHGCILQDFCGLR